MLVEVFTSDTEGVDYIIGMHGLFPFYSRCKRPRANRYAPMSISNVQILLSVFAVLHELLVEVCFVMFAL